jgi:hypothetical protein
MRRWPSRKNEGSGCNYCFITCNRQSSGFHVMLICFRDDSPFRLEMRSLEIIGQDQLGLV